MAWVPVTQYLFCLTVLHTGCQIAYDLQGYSQSGSVRAHPFDSFQFMVATILVSINTNTEIYLVW